MRLVRWPVRLACWPVRLAPSEVIRLLGFDAAVAQPFGVVARQQQLDRGEKRLDEFPFLVVQILPDALGYGNGRAFP